ncbi:unnamed protein product [Arctia plantaginis]|uniref:Uncharacterized protein n=1 Tax=Arctia plantaginis TaxID=874455 RepID=A0A8S0YX95_ARCPL|nr:unnamed protein product [Arctia plantaginis]
MLPRDGEISFTGAKPQAKWGGRAAAGGIDSNMASGRMLRATASATGVVRQEQSRVPPYSLPASLIASPVNSVSTQFHV